MVLITGVVSVDVSNTGKFVYIGCMTCFGVVPGVLWLLL